jgi:hypothetical protein
MNEEGLEDRIRAGEDRIARLERVVEMQGREMYAMRLRIGMIEEIHGIATVEGLKLPPM